MQQGLEVSGSEFGGPASESSTNLEVSMILEHNVEYDATEDLLHFSLELGV